METLLPPDRYTIPDLPGAEELLPFLKRIDENRWYSNFGPLVSEFQKRFASAMAVAHNEPERPLFCLTFSSGYHALVAGLKTLGIGPGSAVLMPAVTFPACPLAAMRLGAEPVLADIDPFTWTLTPAIAKAIAASNIIHAVMPVAIYGMPLPAEEWDAFTRETRIPVLIDAAAAVESQRYLKHGLVAHSLHATKPYGIGEGGLLLSSDPDAIESARRYANFGAEDRLTLESGENAKMSEYHAAVALAQLQRWSAVKERRHRVYEWYEEALQDNGSLLPLKNGYAEAVVSVLMAEARRPVAAEAVRMLQQQHIAVHRMYLPPLYEHPFFQPLPLASSKGRIVCPEEQNQKERLMPNSSRLNGSALGLPFHPFMDREDVQRVINAVGRVLQEAGK